MGASQGGEEVFGGFDEEVCGFGCDVDVCEILHLWNEIVF